MSANQRFLAEWEPSDGVLLALPHEDTDWACILDAALDQYRRLVKALTDKDILCLVCCRDMKEAESLLDECDSASLIFIETDYNDTWTRDYGPLGVMRDDRLRALDFGFNGWGLKFAADKDNLVTSRLDRMGYFEDGVYRNQRAFILEGGSVDTDGRGTVLTTSRCLCSPNRNGGLTKAQATEELMTRLGCDHTLWLDYGALEGDDTDSHIDTLARMAPGDSIVFTGCRNVDDSHFEELLKMRAQLTMLRTAEGEPYNLIELPFPDPVFDDEGNRLPATYANYLVVNGHIFMPSYGQPANDLLAARIIRIAFPDYDVTQVDCRTLLRQHGSLHCATMQLPAGTLRKVTDN